jgi:NOL1/NOP2/sun family putative RNA methylase
VQLPQQLLDAIKGTAGFNEQSFISAHLNPVPLTSVRINPSKVAGINEVGNLSSIIDEKVPWTDTGYYLQQRPSFTFDPLFHAGCYYVQEASSMFLEQALKQHAALSDDLRILDVSAAPGGKSTHIQTLISPKSLLVSNEVIRSRANILRDNIIKWGCENVVVTNNDPRDFNDLDGFFDVMVVDAPCSGSGLFRKEPDAINEWSTGNVQLCSQRQQRILADILPSLKEDGLLIYSTCSYSSEEDESIVAWLIREFELECLKMDISDEWNITETCEHNSYGYRFWPDKAKGEGFFLACLRKKTGSGYGSSNSPRSLKISRSESQMIERWISMEDKEFFKYENTVYAWPAPLKDDIQMIVEKLRVIYSGIRVGELMRDKLVPDHALAVSGTVKENIECVPLDHEQAIRYLQRKDIQINSNTRGWALVTYEGHSLGWVNILSNRINNYYPKELRILKDSDG